MSSILDDFFQNKIPYSLNLGFSDFLLLPKFLQSYFSNDIPDFKVIHEYGSYRFVTHSDELYKHLKECYMGNNS